MSCCSECDFLPRLEGRKTIINLKPLLVAEDNNSSSLNPDFVEKFSKPRPKYIPPRSMGISNFERIPLYYNPYPERPETEEEWGTWRILEATNHEFMNGLYKLIQLHAHEKELDVRHTAYFTYEPKPPDFAQFVSYTHELPKGDLNPTPPFFVKIVYEIPSEYNLGIYIIGVRFLQSYMFVTGKKMKRYGCIAPTTTDYEDARRSIDQLPLICISH